MKHLTTLLFITLAIFQPAANAGEPAPLALAPRVQDYTHMWWAEGFPSHTPSAPWLRCIQTGRYAVVLDTETLRIPHFGPVTSPLDYAACGRSTNHTWQTLPPADLLLTITANGKTYRCTAGGKWTNFDGPRLIESGRFVQRADVTNLVFTANDGARLDTEARFETIAWPDRLGLLLAARPGLAPIPPGETAFGRIGGGFGLDGTNHLEISHSPELDPEQFTIELWAFVPTDHQVSKRTPPWLVCKNHNEHADGNYGIILLGGGPRAVMNIGGGRDNHFFVDGPRPLKTEAWNHLAMTYDGDTLRLYVNGEAAGEKKIGRKRVPGRHGLAFGRREDNSGDGYHFRGVLDEIRLYDRALTPAEVRQRATQPEVDQPTLEPTRQWSFRADGVAASAQPRESWQSASIGVRLKSTGGLFEQHRELSSSGTPDSSEWQEVAVAIVFPSSKTPSTAQVDTTVTVEATDLLARTPCPVEYETARGWHRVNLDGVVPVEPSGPDKNGNNAIERVRLSLTNPDSTEQVARLLLAKTGRGIRVRHGAPITGISAVLRDADGNPTGIPVQLSKNWHNRPEGGTYAGAWFHGFSQVRVPPKATVELELTIAYAHWGGVAAASHAQLCLIGWGSNQLWEQSALGAWGESICYEPDQAQAHAAVLDVRPVMVRSMNRNLPWSWTQNVGGGDFFRFFDPAGNRVFPARMRTAHLRHGPCLTEVTYAGRTTAAIEHSATVSLARTDDIVRGVYRLRMDVKEALDFSRFVIFQIGADTYSYTGERKMAFGNETGVLREWDTQWGGDRYRTDPIECTGRVPWVSLHDAVSRATKQQAGDWANRGVIIRAWDARLGGRKAAPWVAERGVKARGTDTSTIDLIPPPGVTRLEPGDFVEATIEHIIVPQFAEDYYGPNKSLRAALAKWANTWHMIHREATGNNRHVEITTGSLESRHPAVRIQTANNRAELTIAGGLGYVPVTFAGLTSHAGYSLLLDDQPVDQSVHGNDFWQTDHDPTQRRWEITYTLPLDDDRPHKLTFGPTE